MKIFDAYECLLEYYGHQHWWPCCYFENRQWEIMTGAVLTQNCSWNNVEKALQNLRTHQLVTPESILSAPSGELEMAIRAAGFF